MRVVPRRLGASAPLVAGVCWLTYGLIVRQFSPIYYQPTLPIDYLAIAMFSGGLLLLALAVAGIHARQAADAEWDERLGFWVACIGAVMAGIGDFGEDWLQIAALGNLLYFPGMLLLLAGLALFGIGTMRARVLPLWCGTVLLLSPLVAAPLGGLFSKWGGTLLFGCIWILVGLVLWFDLSDRRS